LKLGMRYLSLYKGYLPHPTAKGKLPADWQFANIIAVYKKGNKKDL